MCVIIDSPATSYYNMQCLCWQALLEKIGTRHWRKKKEEDGESGKGYIQISLVSIVCLFIWNQLQITYLLWNCYYSKYVIPQMQLVMLIKIGLHKLLVWREVGLLKCRFKAVYRLPARFIICYSVHWLSKNQVIVVYFVNPLSLKNWGTKMNDRFNCARIHLWDVRVSLIYRLYLIAI